MILHIPLVVSLYKLPVFLHKQSDFYLYPVEQEVCVIQL